MVKPKKSVGSRFFLVKGNEDKYFVSLDKLIQGIHHDLAVVAGNSEHNIELFT